MAQSKWAITADCLCWLGFKRKNLSKWKKVTKNE